MMAYSDTGKIWALDINKGRLRILMEAAKLHNLDDMITDIHADLRLYAVSFQESSLLLIHKKVGKERGKFPISKDNAPPMEIFVRNMASDYYG